MTENEAIKILEERYLTMSMCGDIEQCKRNNRAISEAIIALKEIQKYRSIGTVDECYELNENQKAIKPVFEMNFGDFESRFACICGKRIVVRHNRGVMDNNDAPNYCSNCGQKFDWSDSP